MEWEEFLNNPEFAKVEYSRRMTGRDLFAKVTHDVLECLHSFQACQELISSVQEPPAEAQNWFNKWDSPVKVWLSKINLLAANLGRGPSNHPNWQGFLVNMASILEDVSTFAEEAETLNSASIGKSKKPVDIAAHNIARLRLIHNDIVQREYLKLWLTDYKDLV